MYTPLVYLSFFLPLLLWSASAYPVDSWSLDPTGDLFLQRSFGDTYNCGPLVAIGARKYADNEFTPRNLQIEISEARALLNSYKNKPDNSESRSWWVISDIQVYLRFMGVKTKVHQLPKGRDPAKDIKQLISEKNLLIVNVNMNDIPYGRMTGKPYRTFWLPGGWGHYLTIVGFEERNNETYFKVHDSYSPIGKNRLYSANNIVRAMHRYTPIYLEVEQGV